MSEQARIETAVEMTIDNCEVLRARLAKYEDADGKPITTIAEQARKIEKLEAGIPRLQEQLYQQRKELTALKSQPSGVVDAQRLLDWNRSQPEPRPIVVGREYQVADACARLNQPTSAGDERAAFERVYASYARMTLAEVQALWDGDLYQDQGLRDAWYGWKARAALSANHSEQVRDALAELLECPASVVQATVPRAGIEAAPPYQIVLDVSVSLTRWKKARAAIAAAPSAGSQKEQGE